jgi:hypothetical protein
MRTVTITCDVCKKEIPERGWEDSPQSIKIVTNCTSRNPMERINNKGQFQNNVYESEDVCQPCMRYLARIIANGIEYLGNPDRIK